MKKRQAAESDPHCRMAAAAGMGRNADDRQDADMMDHPENENEDQTRRQCGQCHDFPSSSVSRTLQKIS